MRSSPIPMQPSESDASNFVPLLRIAADPRDLPRLEFRARLKNETHSREQQCRISSLEEMQRFDVSSKLSPRETSCQKKRGSKIQSAEAPASVTDLT